MKTFGGQKTKAVDSQYLQMAHKNSRDISRDIWNFSRYLRFMYLFHDFSRAPQRSSAEFWLENTSLRVDAYFFIS